MSILHALPWHVEIKATDCKAGADHSNESQLVSQNKQVCRWHQFVWCSQCKRRKGWYPKWPWQTQEVGPCKPNEVQQNQAQAVCTWVRAIPDGEELNESSPAEKDLRILVDKSWTWGSSVLLGPQWSTASWTAATGGWQQCREGTIPLCSALVRIHLKYCILAWVTQQRKVGKLLESVQWKAIKMLRGLQAPLLQRQADGAWCIQFGEGKAAGRTHYDLPVLEVLDINRREIQSGLAIDGSQQTLLSVFFFFIYIFSLLDLLCAAFSCAQLCGKDIFVLHSVSRRSRAIPMLAGEAEHGENNPSPRLPAEQSASQIP